MVGSHSRPSPSPGPIWETIQEPEDTPEVSSQDELEQESVLQELLPAALLRKRKEQTVSHEASVKRPRIGMAEDDGFSRGRRDIPSSIQITPRHNLSPGITRRIGEKPVKEKGKLDNSYGVKNNSVKSSLIPRDKVASNLHVTHSGTSISAPNLARKRTKKTARKRASSPPRRPPLLSAATRILKRTREEKRRQNGEDDSSDPDRFLPISPSLPPPVMSSDKASKGAGKSVNKASSSSTHRSLSMSQPLHAAKRNLPEIIDISSDGESGPPNVRLGKDKSDIPRNVFEISSDDDEPTRSRSSSARGPPKTRSISRSVIEILDSDDELDTTLRDMHEDEIMADILAQRTTGEMNRLSLRGSQSPHDESIFLPPESASEGSEDMQFGDAASGSSSSNSFSGQAQTPPKNVDVIPDADMRMDTDGDLPPTQLPRDTTLPSPKINSPRPSVLQSPTAVISNVPPLSLPPSPASPFKSPPGVHSSPTSWLQNDGPETRMNSLATTGDSALIHHPFSPRQRSARKHLARRVSACSAGTPSKKERSISGDISGRVNNPLNSPSRKEITSPSHVPPPSIQTDGAIEEPSSPSVPPPRTRWSLGMNLADAITQTSQDNNRKVPHRSHSEADAIAQLDLQASHEAIEKSKLFLEMVQMSLPNRHCKGTLLRHDSPLNESQRRGTEEATLDSGSTKQEKNNAQVDLDPSAINEQPILGSTILEQEELLQSPAQVELPLPTSDAAIDDNGLNGPETTPLKDNGVESDDELEYIDEPENNIVVQGIADINIADSDVEGINEPELIAQPSPNTTDAPNIINGIVSTPATSLYKPRLVPPSVEGYGIKIDGVTIINWREFRKNFTPKYFLGRDLPHALQDYINHMSDWTRSLPDMRTVFTAAIQENTALDEPDAPPIQVENVVDDEPTPPWEFHYSNYMWHGEGVPPPDVGNLVSCDCIGRCDPRSKTCACAVRQREALGDQNADFAYDNRGRLREPGYPIFECNDLCACDDDCRNRVVQHGRTCAIVIKKTEYKGWGVFAGQKKIYKGAFVGVYAGELITDEEGEERGRYYNKLGKTYLFDIDFHHLRKGRDDWQSKYTVDAYHVGNFTRFLNHSCDPNCILNPCYISEGNIEKPLLAVFARREIEPGEELCFSYSGDVDDEGDDPDEAVSDSGVDDKNDAVYARCYCGARNCKGRLFE